MTFALKSLRENNACLLNAAPNTIFAYVVCVTLPYVYLDVYAYEYNAAYWTLNIAS